MHPQARPRAFAGDAKALETARLALARFYPAAFNLTMRLFFYMPFQHSESRWPTRSWAAPCSPRFERRGRR